MPNVLRDLRYGLRLPLKTPGVTLVAILTLALASVAHRPDSVDAATSSALARGTLVCVCG